MSLVDAENFQVWIIEKSNPMVQTFRFTTEQNMDEFVTAIFTGKVFGELTVNDFQMLTLKHRKYIESFGNFNNGIATLDWVIRPDKTIEIIQVTRQEETNEQQTNREG